MVASGHEMEQNRKCNKVVNFRDKITNRPEIKLNELNTVNVYSI